MRYRYGAGFSILLLASSVMAQNAPAVAASTAGNWAPAVAVDAVHPDQRVPGTIAPTKDHFTFKDRSRNGPLDQPPPRANDKASVMGTDRAWQNGRPPVVCSQTPQDPTCH